VQDFESLLVLHGRGDDIAGIPRGQQDLDVRKLLTDFISQIVPIQMPRHNQIRKENIGLQSVLHHLVCFVCVPRRDRVKPKITDAFQ